MTHALMRPAPDFATAPRPTLATVRLRYAGAPQATPLPASDPRSACDPERWWCLGLPCYYDDLEGAHVRDTRIRGADVPIYCPCECHTRYATP